MDISFSDTLIFGLPALFVVLFIVRALRRPRCNRARAPQPHCVDALEGAGIKLEPDTFCDYAFTILEGLEAYALPVTVGKRFLGFFTRDNVLKRAGHDLANTYVAAVMTAAHNCPVLREDTDFTAARDRLRASPYALLPVLDRNDKLLGFVSEESIGLAEGSAPLPSSQPVF